MLDKKSKIDIKYIDLERAFNLLIHKNLMFMLSKVGIGGNFLKWFSYFLIEHFFNDKIGSVRYA